MRYRNAIRIVHGVGLFLAACLSIASAGTLPRQDDALAAQTLACGSGTVVGTIADADSYAAIPGWAQINAYTFNPDNSQWEWFAYTGVWQEKSFSLSLPVGKYRLLSYSDGYLEEWYNDALPSAAKTIQVKANENLYLSPILLQPEPEHPVKLELLDMRLVGNTMKFKLSLRNNTKRQVTARAWTVLNGHDCGYSVDGYCYYYFSYENYIPMDNTKQVNIAAGGAVSFTLPAVIPGTMKPGKHHLILNAALESTQPIYKASWHPFYVDSDGNISTDEQISRNDAVMADTPRTMRRIPASLDEEGRPLSWMVR